MTPSWSEWPGDPDLPAFPWRRRHTVAVLVGLVLWALAFAAGAAIGKAAGW